MIQDLCDTFCRQLAVTATAGTDYIDKKAAVNLGVGEDLYLDVRVDGEAMTDAGSDSTVVATLEGDSDPAFGTAATLLTLPTFAALSAIGTKRRARLPVQTTQYRYYRVKFTVANGNLSTGKFTAQLVGGIQESTVYPMAGTITS